MLILWRTLLFAALWLVFESVISWAAFCQRQGQYGSTDQATESYECIFRGPAASFSRWFVHTFDKADAYIALFTAILAVGTLALWSSTRKLWNVTRVHAEHIPRVERAYIYGGANYRVTEQGRPVSLFVKVNNFGKTPAFIGTIAATICPELDLTRPITWQDHQWMGWALPAPTYDIGSPVELPFTRFGDVIVGRIWYRDILNDCHSSGFVLRLNTNGLPAVGGEEHWQDRPEPDPRSPKQPPQIALFNWTITARAIGTSEKKTAPAKASAAPVCRSQPIGVRTTRP